LKVLFYTLVAVGEIAMPENSNLREKCKSVSQNAAKHYLQAQEFRRGRHGTPGATFLQQGLFDDES